MLRDGGGGAATADDGGGDRAEAATGAPKRRSVVAAMAKRRSVVSGGDASDAKERNGDDREVLSGLEESEVLELLERSQQCSPHLRDLDAEELTALSREMTVLRFRAGETLVVQGEPATFFGVVLEGSLTPVVGGRPAAGCERGIGEIIGEMSLFAGGTRNGSLVGASAGLIAVYQFAELERLKRRNGRLALKVNTQLARAALSKRLEMEGARHSPRSCSRARPSSSGGG